MFEIGDRVRRIRLTANSERWRGMGIGDEDVVIATPGTSIDLLKFGKGHDAIRFELVAPNKTVDDEIADLEKQLADLRAKKLEESLPKVGKTYSNSTGVIAYVYENLDGRVFYRYKLTPSSPWNGMSTTLQSFLENYDVK